MLLVNYLHSSIQPQVQRLVWQAQRPVWFWTAFRDAKGQEEELFYQGPELYPIAAPHFPISLMAKGCNAYAHQQWDSYPTIVSLQGSSRRCQQWCTIIHWGEWAQRCSRQWVKWPWQPRWFRQSGWRPESTMWISEWPLSTKEFVLMATLTRQICQSGIQMHTNTSNQQRSWSRMGRQVWKGGQLVYTLVCKQCMCVCQAH